MKVFPGSNKGVFFSSGGLVRKILETKKELEGGGNQESRPKQVRLLWLHDTVCVIVWYWTNLLITSVDIFLSCSKHTKNS